MTTSNTYNFSPSIGDLALNAFSRIQIKPSALVQEHMLQLRIEGNLLQAQWSNVGVTLWTVDLQTVPLVQGTATYTVPPSTVMILDTYISTGSPPTNRIIMPMSRTDYAALPQPAEQAVPTTYWFDRLINPTISLWPVPDGSASYTLSYYRYRQIQDATFAGGNQPEVQYLFLDAWTAGLAHRLSRHFAPSLEALRKVDAAEAFDLAAKQNVEGVNFYVYPALQAYWRP